MNATKRPIRGAETVYLPNKGGEYVPVRIPKYIQEILSHTKNDSLYTYKVVGVNPVRPGYGVQPDGAKLAKWASRYHSESNVVRVNEERKNYYCLVEITDPIANQLEKAGWLQDTIWMYASHS